MSQISIRSFTSTRVAPPRVCPVCVSVPACPKTALAPSKPLSRFQRRGKALSASATEVPEAEEPAPEPTMSVEDLKAALLDSLFGLERGLKARGEIKAELNELIGQLESCNPTPSPTEAEDMLSGNWKLVYTTNPSVLALIGLSNLPLVKIGDITQTIDGPAMTVENKIQVTVPFSRTAFSTSASFDVSSPKRLRLQYNSGNISTPELLEDIDLPESISLLGQNVDLSPLKQALQPLNSTVKDAVAQLGNIISQQPDLKIPIQEDRAPVTWLLTTFLDNDTRISRGDGGTVYVLVKDVSFEDTPAEESTDIETDLSIEADAPVEETTYNFDDTSSTKDKSTETSKDSKKDSTLKVDSTVVEDTSATYGSSSFSTTPAGEEKTKGKKKGTKKEKVVDVKASAVKDVEVME